MRDRLLVLSQEHRQLVLPKVESIDVDESLFGRMLGYGRVIVRGTGGTFGTFDKIAHPNELRRQVRQQIGSSVSA
ncbi:MAG: PH domain-containing protein [Ktedonobacteraceae bacterium]